MSDGNEDEIPCRQTPCLPARRPPASQNANENLQGRPILFAGVVWIGIVRRFLIPRSCTPVPQESVGVKSRQASNRNVAQPVSASETLQHKNTPAAVPLITEYPEAIAEDPKSSMLLNPNNIADFSLSPLRALKAQVEEASSVVVAQARSISEDLGVILQDAQGSAGEMFEMLRSEDNQTSRLAAISIGSLIGFMCGLRRGVVPQMTYSITGASATAAICYPEDTKSCNRRVLTVVRQVVNAARSGPQTPLVMGDWYNFKNSIIKISVDEDETQDAGDKFNDTKGLNTKSDSTNAIKESSVQNVQSSHLTEKITVKPKESNLKPLEVESIKVVVTNPERPENSISDKQPSVGNVFHVQPDQVEDDSVTIKNLTTKPSSHSVPDSSNHVKNHSEETTMIETNQSNLKSPTSDELPNKIDNADGEDVDEDRHKQQNDKINDFSETVFLVPTGRLKEKLDVRHDDSRETSQDNSDERPINKKLAPYYRTLPDEEVHNLLNIL